MAAEGITAPNRFGDTLNNFLKVYSGQTAVAYRKKTVMDGLHPVITIEHGESVQWPTYGDAKAVRHVVGENILMEGGGTSKYLSDPMAGEKVVLIDNPVTSNIILPKIDEQMSHYGIRGPAKNKLGEALAIECDLDRMMVLCHAARDAAHLNDAVRGGSWSKTGAETLDADFSTNASSAKDTIFATAQLFDEKDVPSEGRYVLVTPEAYYNLSKDSEVSSTDYNRNTGGDQGLGRVLMLAGIHIIKTNRIVDLQGYSTTYASTPKAGQRGTDYLYPDFGKVEAIAFQSEAIGMVKLGEMDMHGVYKEEYRGFFITCGKTYGVGAIRNPNVNVILNTAHP